jgi:hypothetical protein
MVLMSPGGSGGFPGRFAFGVPGWEALAGGSPCQGTEDPGRAARFLAS